jgi:hypothetical protein
MVLHSITGLDDDSKLMERRAWYPPKPLATKEKDDEEDLKARLRVVCMTFHLPEEELQSRSLTAELIVAPVS